MTGSLFLCYHPDTYRAGARKVRPTQKWQEAISFRNENVPFLLQIADWVCSLFQTIEDPRTGCYCFQKLIFVFQRQFPELKNQTDSQILLSDRRFMQKQTLLGRANRVRDKPEFYPVGSRHFVRLFSTYPSDTSVGRRLVGGEKSHAIKQF